MSYYFRVDANEQIGIGHMMRCLSIAKAMRRLGTECTFFVADKASAAVVAEAGFGYVCLNSDYDHLDVECSKLLQIMRERVADNLLVDSYFVTESYLARIREVANLSYIDDINKFIYPCDLLINYNIYAEDLRYPERYREAGLSTEFALGLEYMPLRDAYLNIQPVAHEGFRVLVTTGATDSLDVLGHLLETLTTQKMTDRIEVTAIVGRYNPHGEALRARYGSDPNIHLVDPQPDLVDLIASSDMAVTAGGTTVYELCAGGLPSVLLTIADNQKRAAEKFSASGIIPYAGDVRTDMEGVCGRVADEIRACMDDPERLLQRRDRMRRVIDGHGGERLAQLLLDRMRGSDGHLGIG